MIEYNRNTGFIKSRYMGVHINWAIERLSSFTKLYKSMKKKTIAIIEREQYCNDMNYYINLYTKKICNDGNMQIYNEEDEDDKSYYSNDSSNLNIKKNNFINNKNKTNKNKNNVSNSDISNNENYNSSNEK
jgi:hypothetical protein